MYYFSYTWYWRPFTYPGKQFMVFGSWSLVLSLFFYLSYEQPLNKSSIQGVPVSFFYRSFLFGALGLAQHLLIRYMRRRKVIVPNFTTRTRYVVRVPSTSWFPSDNQKQALIMWVVWLLIASRRIGKVNTWRINEDGHEYVAVHDRMLRLLYTDLIVVFLFLRKDLDGWTGGEKVKQLFYETKNLGSRAEWDMYAVEKQQIED